METFVLIVFILINGSWVSGDNFDGWGRTIHESKEACLERKEFAEQNQIRIMKINPRFINKKFVCEPTLKPQNTKRK